MKNRMTPKTVVIIAAGYLVVLGIAVDAGGAVLIPLVLYSVASIAGGKALLAADLARSEQDALKFRKEKPLRGLGASLVEFQHLFYHDTQLLSVILNEINTRLVRQGFLPALVSRAYTDTDKNLSASETREFFVASSEPNLRGTKLALALHLKGQADAQSIHWWVLMRGFVNRDKKILLLASAPIALPFWVWAYFRQELDIASFVRTAYDAFYNSLDVSTDARALHILVFNTLVDTLDRHGIDISDLKQQRAQSMNINITGGRTRFGNVVQALQQAHVAQTGAVK